MRFSKEKEESIIQDYLNGDSTVKIATKWNTYNTSIRRVLKRYNIPLRNLKEANSRVKICPFKDNDEYSEYFLGLLLTDGCIYKSKNSYSTSLTLKDKELVEEFRDFINPEAKVSKILQKKYGTYVYSYSVRSDLVADWLNQRGNFVDKSNKCDIYCPINWHVLRGIFDGDGYWHPTNKGNTMAWGICGKSEMFLIKIKDFLTTQNIKSHLRKVQIGGTSYLFYLEVTKLCDAVKIAKMMYSGAHIFLKRKYERWHLFEETLREKFLKFREGEAPLNPEPSHNRNNHLYNKKDGRFIMEGAETIIGYLNL